MRPRGFTLIEVIVALTLTGLVVLMARRLVQVTIDSVRVLSIARSVSDRDGNGRAWLRGTLLSLDAGDSTSGFTGNRERMEFSAWVPQVDGWFARKRIVLAAQDGQLRATGVTAMPIVLSDSVERVTFDYLIEPGANSRWVEQWISPVSAPLCVRLVLRHAAATDTLLFLVGERG